MLLWLDNFLSKIAKILIDINYFIGINRKQTMIITIIFSNLCYCLLYQFNNYGQFKLNFLWIIAWLGINMPLHIFNAIFKYREDNILSNDTMLSSYTTRAGIQLLFLINEIYYIVPCVKNNVFPLKPLLNLALPLFYYYIILNQNHKSKYRLKSLLRLLGRKISAAVRWRPSPNPLPQPTNIR
ncbi:MAG: hypothetical protein WCP93_03520 [Candidatus Berkelbacteria bacterium]